MCWEDEGPLAPRGASAPDWARGLILVGGVGWGCVCLPLPSRADALSFPSGLTPSHDRLEGGDTSGGKEGDGDLLLSRLWFQVPAPTPAPPSPKRPQMSCGTRTWGLSRIPPPYPAPSGGRTRGDPEAEGEGVKEGSGANAALSQRSRPGGLNGHLRQISTFTTRTLARSLLVSDVQEVVTGSHPGPAAGRRAHLQAHLRARGAPAPGSATARLRAQAQRQAPAEFGAGAVSPGPPTRVWGRGESNEAGEPGSPGAGRPGGRGAGEGGAPPWPAGVPSSGLPAAALLAAAREQP